MSSRPKRTSEAAMRIAVLQIAAAQPNGEADTSKLKDLIPKYLNLTPDDYEESSTRKGEPKWAQIVGNVISHQSNSTSIFNNGYADRTEDGIRITDAGRAYLKSKGL